MSVPDEIRRYLKLGDQAQSQGDLKEALRFYLEGGSKVVKHLWGFETGQKVRALYAYDINSDGEDEIIIGSEDCKIHVVDSRGNKIWDYQTNSWVMGVGAFDIDGDGDVEIIAGSDSLYIFSSTGTLKRTIDIQDTISSLRLGSQKGSSNSVIVTGHDNGAVIGWSPTGIMLWRYKTPKRVICLSYDDIDDDGENEIVVGAEDKRIYILDESANLKDVFELNHWIFSISACRIGEDTGKRLFIGSFEGDVHLYKHYKERDSVTLRVRQHGILSLAAANLLADSPTPQIVVGSSDKAVSVLDMQGSLLWRFEPGYGHRVLIVKQSQQNDVVNVVVGAEFAAHSYLIHIIPGLADGIRSVYKKLGIKNLATLDIPNELAEVLKTFVIVDPINYDARVENVQKAILSNRLDDAISMAQEIWWNKLEFNWYYETSGRIYALSCMSLNTAKENTILAGSEDGFVYALGSKNGNVQWKFGAKGGVRGVSSAPITNEHNLPHIAIASVDGNVYLLSEEGNPIWNFQTQEWALYSCLYDINGDGLKEILVGSDDHCIYVFSSKGQLLWRYGMGDRVRAITAGDIDNDGVIEVVAGSDDQWVYVIKPNGRLKHKFQVPHWVLAIQVEDIDGDGSKEILIGTEDGHLYVYSNSGVIKWKFPTGHWIAALGTYKNLHNGNIDIAVGSADRNIYGLSGTGKLLWVFETGARVRTLLPVDANNDNQMEIIFGSYDQRVYSITLSDSSRIDTAFNEIMRAIDFQLEDDVIEKYRTSRRDTLRAFAFYKLVDDPQNGVDDPSAIVRGASGCAMLAKTSSENESYIQKIAKLLTDKNPKVLAMLYPMLGPDMLEDRDVAYKILQSAAIRDNTPFVTIQILRTLREWIFESPEPFFEILLRLVFESQDSWVKAETSSLIHELMIKLGPSVSRSIIGSEVLDKLVSHNVIPLNFWEDPGWHARQSPS